MTFADCAAAGLGIILEAECNVCGATWYPDCNSESLRHRTIQSARLACIAVGPNGRPPCPGTGFARLRRDVPVLHVSLIQASDAPPLDAP